MTTQLPRILFCHCTYAQVVPKDVKEFVLRKLCESGLAFDAVADLCEMSARRDPGLKRLADGAPVRIAACYPRAVKGLFGAAQAPLSAAATEVLNMRVQTADEVWAGLIHPELRPNLPAVDTTGETAVTKPDAATSAPEAHSSATVLSQNQPVSAP